MERASTGDREAFETLIRKYSRLVYAQIWGMVRNRDDAEDLVQAAFFKAWKSLATLRDAGAFPGWLLSISANLARDHGKKKRPAPIPEEAEQLVDESGPNPGGRLEPLATGCTSPPIAHAARFNTPAVSPRRQEVEHPLVDQCYYVTLKYNNLITFFNICHKVVGVKGKDQKNPPSFLFYLRC